MKNWMTQQRIEAQVFFDEAPAVVGATVDSPLGGQASVAAPTGAESVAGSAGTDTVAGTKTDADKLYGDDSAAGADTTAGTDTSAGTDTVAGTDTESGNDSLTAASYSELKLPDTLTVNDDALGAFKDWAVTNGIKPEEAQKAIDMFGSQLTAQADVFANAQKQAWDTTITAWKADLAKEPAFAGDKAAGAQAIIGRALDVYGDQSTRDAFDLTGAGHNPAVVKFVHKMALALDEGNLIPGAQPVRKQALTLGERLYGSEG